jgi:uncharacterized protein
MEELLKLARNALTAHLNEDEIIVSSELKKEYREKGACFVTLTLNGQLRGCIGSLIAHRPLYLDVVENAVHSGFNDYRFLPLTKPELSKIKIEISILSKPLPLGIGKDVYGKIDNTRGIILKKGFKSATFLPQVWEQIPDKTEFLEELSQKAGMLKDAWKDSEISYYTVKSVKE